MMTVYFNLFAAAVAINNLRLMFPCYLPSMIKDAPGPPTKSEDYGSWMSTPVFYMVGGLTALAALLAVLSFVVFHIFVPGILFVIIVAGLLALFGWITWIMMAKEHCWM